MSAQFFTKMVGGEGEASHSFITSLLSYLVASSRRVVSFHPVNILLSEIECRVLCSLIEKEITTPEYYPLSLNALLGRKSGELVIRESKWLVLLKTACDKWMFSM